ncbi:hypothetical protein UNDYM_0499 [Undibacterium sp. YM2]|jgi:hypothetical protein|nr:hypothetical protein UNDYM_0499 [Undibacterium sp. YM2]
MVVAGHDRRMTVDQKQVKNRPDTGNSEKKKPAATASGQEILCGKQNRMVVNQQCQTSVPNF